MHPVLTTLEFAGITRTIGSYGALLALAIVVGSILLLRAAVRAGLEVGAVISALAGALLVGFMGAYLTSSLTLWPQLGSLWAGLAQPGIVFHGGALFGGGAFALLARRFGLPVARTLDAAIPALPVAHAIGRLGCFLGGCCYGAQSSLPWAVVAEHALAPAAHPALPRHPWPLYEACGLLALAVGFAVVRSAAPAGARAARYVLAYATLRCLLEPLRGDEVRGLLFSGRCSVAQLLCLVCAALAFSYLRALRHRDVLCVTPAQV